MARKRKPASKKSGGSSVIGIIIVCAVPIAIYLGLPKDAQEAVKDKASKTMAKVKEGARVDSDPIRIGMSDADVDTLATKVSKERIKKFWSGEFDAERYKFHMDRIKPKVIREIKLAVKVKQINRDEYHLPESVEKATISRLTSNARSYEVRDSLVREILEAEKRKYHARKEIDGR